MGTISDTDTLFPMPEPTRPAEMTIEDRMEEFSRVAKGKGGLIPVSAGSQLLGISRQRVYQLIDSGRLERIHYCGVAFLTGRSIRDWQADDKQQTGRGNRKIGFFKSVVIGASVGAKIGAAMAEVAVPLDD